MPVSATAMRASGMRASAAASAALRKMRSTCSWENSAYSACAFLTRAISASSSPLLLTVFSNISSS